MKTRIGGIKTARKLNSSKLSPATDITEIEEKFKNFEGIIFKLSLQNEALSKRIEDLEALSAGKIAKSNSLKSLSTLNDSEVLESSAIMNKDSKNKQKNEWKKSIEKSIETLNECCSDNNSNIMITVLEKKINDINNEVFKIKFTLEQNLDNTNIIKKNIEKFDKTEKIISLLLSQLSEIKMNNIKFQTEFVKNLDECKEKISIQESASQKSEKFESSIEKKIENLNLELQYTQKHFSTKVDDLDTILKRKTKHFGDEYVHLYDENLRLNSKVKEEAIKLEVSLKALWDSFAILTTNMGNL